MTSTFRITFNTSRGTGTVLVRPWVREGDMVVMWDVVKPLGYLFYLVDPKELQSTDLDNVPDLIAKAVPYFFLLMLIEGVVAYMRGYKAYEFKDTIFSLSLGITQQLVGIFVKTLSYGPYIYLYHHYRLLTIPPTSTLSFVALLLGCDFYYYWYHRLCHEYHALWAAHIVHHSGEYYNLTTALRQGSLQSATSWIAYLPLALLGLHPASFILHNQLNTLYQFWIHTEQIGSIGILENILNTPSHHRMHHRPPGNCNYAGVLIIWDRLFGTFVQETQQVNFYGLAKQLTTYNPLAANIRHWQTIIALRQSSSDTLRYVTQALCNVFTHRARHALTINIMPTLLPANAVWTLPLKTKRQRYHGRESSVALMVYMGVQFVTALATGYGLLLFQSSMPWLPCCALATYSLSTLCCIGRLAEGHRLAYALETCRVFLAALLMWLLVMSYAQWDTVLGSSVVMLQPFVPQLKLIPFVYVGVWGAVYVNDY